MNGRKKIGRVLVLVSLVLIASPVMVAQEMDYNQEQYDQYTAAVNAEDPAERLTAILNFSKQNPGLSLVQYALLKYVEVMQEYQKEGKLAEVVTAGENLLEIKPDEINALYLVGVSAFQLNDFAKAAKYSEAAYEKNPNPGLLYILAVSNQKQSATDKFKQYGEQVIDALEPAQFLPGHFEIVAGLRGAYTETNLTKAAGYAKKIIEALDAVGTPAGANEADWKRYANAERALNYALLGQAAVKQENWPEAVSNYQRVTRFTSDKNLKSEAYYFIGRGRWEQNRLDPAMEAFAMGSVLEGASNAEACKGLLERLYRATHNGSLAGLDEFIARVTIK